MRQSSLKRGIAALAAAILATTLGIAPVSALAEEGVVVTDAVTLQAALDDTSVSTITLGDDITHSVTVPAGRSVTIDLNGHTLTNEAGKHTVVNNGTLTITGEGTVDNVSHGRAALLNDGGDATIASGTFTRSAEAGTSAGSNGNSWYVVYNQSGNLTMNGGSVAGTSGFSSCLRNDGTMNFNGGTIEQPVMIALKNEGTLVMDGGVVNSANGLQNWGNATIKSGEVNGIVTDLSWDESESGNLEMTGGKVTGDVIVVKYTGSSSTPSLKVSGGAFVGGTITATTGTSVNPEVNTPSAEVAANVAVNGGTFAKAAGNVDFVTSGNAMVSRDGGFEVVSDNDAADGSLAAVNVGGKKVYFADLDSANDFAAETGAGADAVERVNYVVSFETNGHGSVDSVQVRSGDALGTLPAVPAVDGYDVAGWYDGDQKVDETYVPTSDVTLVAKWTKAGTQAGGNAGATKPGTDSAAGVKAPAGDKKALPQTGDTSNMVAPIVIALVGVVAVGAAVVVRRRNN